MPEDTCDLCGLPLRFGTVRLERGCDLNRFCCQGCRQVFSMLLEAADPPEPSRFRDTPLFRRCRELGIIPASLEDLARPSPEPPRGPAAASEGTGRPDGQCLLEAHLDVADMWCPACAWVIEQALLRQEGVVAAACNFSTDRVRCTYDPVHTSPDRMVPVLAGLGYRASIPGRGAADKSRRRELLRLAVSAVLTANVMMLSFALYSGFLSRLDAETIRRISWPIFTLAGVVFFYGGAAIHKKAWAGLASAAPGMETLISIGATAAYLYSTVNFMRGGIHLYFDTASMLITLVLVGKTLEGKARDRVRDDLAGFFSLRPAKARVCTREFPQGRYVSAGQLAAGDLFIVREGEIVPADGVVLSGRCRVDASSLTGEAVPIPMQAPDRIRSGTRVLSGSVRARAEAVGADSVLGQMVAVMERALGAKTPVEGRTDRLLRGFVPAIVLLAAATGGVCLIRGLPFEGALMRAVTVLVIACPCSLGIAIPMSRVAGISVAARSGVVVRDFAAFERAADIQAFVFDKTGTLTEGRWHLRRIRLRGPLSEEQALALAAGLEREADHPVSALIRGEALRRGIAPLALGDRRVHANGISAVHGGRRVKIGAETFVAGELAADDRRAWGEAPADGDGTTSQVYLSVGGHLCAVFEFGDALRAGAADAVRRLAARGYRLALVSGDGEGVTRALGSRLAVDAARGGLLPAEKAAFVADWQAGGSRVAMVGDGVNDAPALARSDLGIAIHSGSHLARETADITLMRADPGQVPEFLDLAERVNRNIRQNLGCAFVYNALSIPIAMSGLLTPLVAVCAMLLSSLTVIGNSLRLSRRSPAAGDARPEGGTPATGTR